MDARQALSGLIDAIDRAYAFEDLEAGCDGGGPVVQACRAINKPIPKHLAAWLASSRAKPDDDAYEDDDWTGSNLMGG